MTSEKRKRVLAIANVVLVRDPRARGAQWLRADAIALFIHSLMGPRYVWQKSTILTIESNEFKVIRIRDT